jgi:hypothetical protein
MTATYAAGTLVSARGRDWVVLPESTDGFLVVRPLGGSDDDVAAVLPEVEEVTPASFPPPTLHDLGDQLSANLLRPRSTWGSAPLPARFARSDPWPSSRAPIS